ncbi:MAG: hypothetical protein IH934_03440 [Nanoarchaeota archaeon]|nr:hypothetical protein [Nanoarchaeota archaeon]
MNKELKIKFSLLCVSIILMLIIGEVVIRFYYHATDKIIAKDQEELCAKGAYIKAANVNDPNRYNPGDTTYLEYSNYTGIRPKANWNVNYIVTLENYSNKKIKYYIFNTNSKHIRGLKDINYTKNPNKTRIAILGDSFTWGADVSIKFSYVSMLEELIPNSEVLNFGIEGIGIDTMYLRWKYEALKFSPDIVIFAIYTDNIARAQPCIHKPKLIVKDNKLKITNIPPPSYEEIYKTYKEPKLESYLIKHLLYNLKYVKGVSKTQYEYGFDILDLILDEIKDKSKEDNTHFIVLIIDRGNDYINTKVELRVIERLKNMLKQKNIKYIDSESIFWKENYIPTDNSNRTIGHFTPEGNSILAQGIKNKLEDEHIIPKYKDYTFKWVIDYYGLDTLILQNKQNSSDIIKIYPYEVITS